MKKMNCIVLSCHIYGKTHCEDVERCVRDIENGTRNLRDALVYHTDMDIYEIGECIREIREKETSK